MCSFFPIILNFVRYKIQFLIMQFQLKLNMSDTLGPKISNSRPQSLKNKESVDTCKTAIKTWKPNRCPCRICKTYLQNIRYL